MYSSFDWDGELYKVIDKILSEYLISKDIKSDVGSV
jgi:hypothetical protein